MPGGAAASHARPRQWGPRPVVMDEAPVDSLLRATFDTEGGIPVQQSSFHGSQPRFAQLMVGIKAWWPCPESRWCVSHAAMGPGGRVTDRL